MNWVDDTLAEFGRVAGLPGLAPDASGAVQLSLGSGAVLGIQPVQADDSSEIVVYMGRPVGLDKDRLLRQALSLAHWRNAPALPVQVALRGEGPDAKLLAAVRLSQRQFTLPSLTHAIDFLIAWLDKVADIAGSHD